MENAQLNTILTTYIQQGKEITLTWDCGGDEAMVTVLIDKTESHDEMAMALGWYLCEYLDLPDAGEFFMTGTGKINQENGTLVVEYTSTMHGYMDYDMETFEETGWKDVNEVDASCSGKKVLFV